MRRTLLTVVGLLTIAFTAGCGAGGEVKAEDVKGYQDAGRAPGDKAERASEAR